MNILQLIIGVIGVLGGIGSILLANAQDKLVESGQIPAGEIKRIRVLGGGSPQNPLFIIGILLIVPGIAIAALAFLAPELSAF